MPGVEATMHEFKHGQLHSGSKKGPIVKNRKQAIAIALNEERQAGREVKAFHDSVKKRSEKVKARRRR